MLKNKNNVVIITFLFCKLNESGGNSSIPTVNGEVAVGNFPLRMRTADEEVTVGVPTVDVEIASSDSDV